MKALSIAGLVASLLFCSSVAAHAQQTPAAPGTTPPATVHFTDLADMPGLTDPSQKNHFTVGISDPQVDVQLLLNCSPGGSQLLFLHKDKVCAFQTGSSGSVINPNNPKQEVPRTQYVGGYDVQANGVANGAEMALNYLVLGNAPASTAQFGGSMHLKASLNGTGLSALEQTITNKLGLNGNDQTIDKRLDSVSLDGFFIPGAGWPNDHGCTWDGQLVFAYQTSSWFIDVQAQCNGQKYDFKGNMPWTAVKGVDNQMQYDLNITLPNDKATGDDSLFQSGDSTDLFASVPGIKGTIIQKNSNNVTVTVDGQATDTPSRVDASGDLVGTNVPLPVVRSTAILFGLLSDNLFGA